MGLARALVPWPTPIPENIQDPPARGAHVSSETETIILGGGCFWCLDAVYREVEGVISSLSGYAGGAGANPSYEAVCRGNTGHAEVVQVVYDPAIIGTREILEIFFTIHDPTTVDRQGNDVGSQYRSVIFYSDDKQRMEAEKTIEELSAQGLWKDPVVTGLAPAPVFYEAEAYHQDYFAQNPAQPYCRAVVSPKVAKFRQKWAGRLRSVA